MGKKIIKESLSSEIGKGVTTSQIKSIYEVDSNTLKRCKLELLTPVVKDDMLLDILTEPNNFNKLKTRMEYQVTLLENTSKVGFGKKFNETPENVINQLKSIKKGEQVTYLEKFKQMGMVGFRLDKTPVTITDIKVQLIFRKG